jgi:Uma2 family endonuclease
MMVAISRRTHGRSAPLPDADPPLAEPPAPVQADPVVSTEPVAEERTDLRTLREVYDHLVGRTKLRAEIIDGRLIVSPLGTPQHQKIAGRLHHAMFDHVEERGWDAFPGLDVCMDGSRDPYQPDYVVAPPDAPRWGDRELFLSGLIMVGEVVSKSSVEIDWDDKPGIYATGGVPVYLIIDPVSGPGTVTVFSEPKEGQYNVSATVTMGGTIYIPDPVDFSLDTSLFL